MHADLQSLFILGLKFLLTHREAATRLLEIHILLTEDPALK